MSVDILYNAAKSFEKLTENDYIFTLGNNKRKIIITLISNDEAEFNHIIGLDHLTDIPDVTAKKASQKKAIYTKICDGSITYETIKGSQFLNSPIPGSHNSKKSEPYTIYDRIEALQSIDSILDKAYTGNLYKWNMSKSTIVLPGEKRTRQTSINADYMLSIPTSGNENMYFFMYVSDSTNGKPLRLNIFSAFPDCLDLSQGQERPYTILEEAKYNIATKKPKYFSLTPHIKQKKLPFPIQIIL